jgi:uncharacterized delta-60 repeat protein
MKPPSRTEDTALDLPLAYPGRPVPAALFACGWSLACPRVLCMRAGVFFVLCAGVAAFAQDDTVVSRSAFGGGQGVNGRVLAVAVQADGKILLAGQFSAVNGVPRGNFARLNPDGTLDQQFAASPVAGVNGTLNALAIRPDGSIVVGGTFSQAGGVARNNIALFRPDGSVDATFASKGYPGANGAVLALAALDDGSVIAGGEFTAVCGLERIAIARINPDGSLAAAIPDRGPLEGTVHALAPLQPESAVAGGTFRAINQPAASLLRIPPATASMPE